MLEIFLALFPEGAVALIDIEIIGRYKVIPNEDIRPAVVIKVGRQYAQAKAYIR